MAMTLPDDFEDETDPAGLPNFGRPDEWVSSQLDCSSETSNPADAQTVPEEFTASEKFRAADLLWIQVLLDQALNPQATTREAQIQRAMSAIARSESTLAARQPTPVSATPSYQPTRRFRTAWITAVAVVIVCGLWFQATNPSRQARAAVKFIRRVAAQATDREYQATITLTPDSTEDESAAPREIQGNLFVRGGEAFAFQAPAVIGTGSIWLGGTASGVWLKPAIGPLVFEGQPGALMKRWLKRPIETQFLQITSVLSRLEENYAIEMLPDEIPPTESLKRFGNCRRLRGTCRTPNQTLPSSIDVWSDRVDGNVVRLELNWESDSQHGQLHLEFNYVKQDERPNDWYRPEGHARGKIES